MFINIQKIVKNSNSFLRIQTAQTILFKLDKIRCSYLIFIYFFYSKQSMLSVWFLCCSRVAVFTFRHLSVLPGAISAVRLRRRYLHHSSYLLRSSHLHCLLCSQVRLMTWYMINQLDVNWNALRGDWLTILRVMPPFYGLSVTL